MTRIAIIGAGPSGLLLSLYLTHHSKVFQFPLTVSVFEREANHDNQDRSNPDRSYTIDITGHGLKAVRSVSANLEQRFDKELIPFRGVHAYTINKTLPYEEKGWTGSRGDICSCLLHELEASLATANELIDVQLHWNTTITSVDPVQGIVAWRGEETEFEESFDLVVGADGGGSMLRRTLEDLQLLTTEKKSIPNFSRILHLENNSPESSLQPDLLHGFCLNPWAVGGAILDVSDVASTRDFDQSTLPKQFYVQMGYSSDAAFANTSAADTELQKIRLPKHHNAHRIDENAVSLRHYVSDEELQSFANRPVYHTGKTVKCSTIAVEKCALIGDASTAFPPVGQGVNAALEGAAFLGELLVRQLTKSVSPVDLESALASYNRQWLPQASACADIANTVVYGSTLSRSKLLLQGALGAVTGVDFAAAQIAKNSKYSYVEAKQKSKWRNSLAVTVLVVLSVVLVAQLF